MILAALVAGAIGMAPGAVQSFETVTKLPSDWQVLQYHPDVSNVSIKTGNAADGSKFLRISAPSENHTRVLVPLRPAANATYHVSAQVRVSGAKAGDAPAVLALDGNANVTTKSIAQDGKWHAEDLYIRTGSAEKVDLTLSLGWFGNVTPGVADFDDIKVEKVDTVPEGATVADTADLNAASAPAAGAPAASAPAPADDDGPPGGTIGLVILIAVLIGGALWILSRGGEGKPDDESADADEPKAEAAEPDASEAEPETAEADAAEPQPADDAAADEPEPDAADDAEPGADADGRGA